MKPIQKNKYFKKRRNNYLELGQVCGEKLFTNNEGDENFIYLEEILTEE